MSDCNVGDSKPNTYVLRSGLFTLLNSKHAKVPPGFRTRWASFSTSGMDVQFRIPKAIVYRSYVLSGNSSLGKACALASRKAICGAANVMRDVPGTACNIYTLLRALGSWLE